MLQQHAEHASIEQNSAQKDSKRCICVIALYQQIYYAAHMLYNLDSSLDLQIYIRSNYLSLDSIADIIQQICTQVSKQNAVYTMLYYIGYNQYKILQLLYFLPLCLKKQDYIIIDIQIFYIEFQPAIKKVYKEYLATYMRYTLKDNKASIDYFKAKVKIYRQSKSIETSFLVEQLVQLTK